MKMEARVAMLGLIHSFSLYHHYGTPSTNAGSNAVKTKLTTARRRRKRIAGRVRILTETDELGEFADRNRAGRIV